MKLNLVIGSICLIWIAISVTSAVTVHADEGMWVFNNLPLAHLKARYGFEPPAGWADHLRSAAVRFNSGGSGAFVSANGLIMTNHHIGADTLAKLGTKDHDYYRDGFFAHSYEEETKSPDLELNVVMGIEDVTARVNRAVAPGTNDALAAEARRKATAAIEQEATEKNGLRNDVVTLYQGGLYHLYTYKKYTDVRLVFAPEFDIAFFGGDPDNFEYPRYDLDVCFFRAYEDGKPAKIEHYLKWSPAGAKEGELVFVAGNPGRTDRLNTVASLLYLRDVEFPLRLDMLESREAFLLAYGRRSHEASRHSKEELFTIQNSRKSRIGGLLGLRDQAFMARKVRDEAELRTRVQSSAAGPRGAGVAWEKITAAKKVAAKIASAYFYHERGYAFDSELFTIARTLVRLANEKTKPNSDRLKEFRDSAMKSLELELFSEAPIYAEFEEARLAESLGHWKLRIPDDPLLEQVFAGRSPAEAARQVVGGSKIADVTVRRMLADGGVAAIEKSDDPMIKLALLVDPAARAVRKVREDQVEGPEDVSYAQIAKANFELKGDAVYPDATFTLRLAFGVVKGYKLGAETIPPFTTLEGAFAHAKYHGDKPPYQLPKSWHDARAAGRLGLEVPFNFVSTADIIGGNSGSPVVNRDNEVVGLIFDGNIQSLVLDFGYDDRVARAVSVDSRGIIEALQAVYGAGRLVTELTGR
jgi:peptidase S46-like protein